MDHFLSSNATFLGLLQTHKDYIETSQEIYWHGNNQIKIEHIERIICAINEIQQINRDQINRDQIDAQSSNVDSSIMPRENGSSDFAGIISPGSEEIVSSTANFDRVEELSIASQGISQASSSESDSAERDSCCPSLSIAVKSIRRFVSLFIRAGNNNRY